MDKRECLVKRWHIGGGITIIFSKTVTKPPKENAQEVSTDNKTAQGSQIISTR